MLMGRVFKDNELLVQSMWYARYTACLILAIIVSVVPQLASFNVDISLSIDCFYNKSKAGRRYIARWIIDDGENELIQNGHAGIGIYSYSYLMRAI